MDTLRHHMSGDRLVIELEGHIDSTNAGDVDQSISAIRTANPAEAIELDCEKLEYCSSAGLRVILSLKKTVDDTRLVNVSPAVYEVLDMTGFTELMEIRKAYRVISVEGCEVIGQGANGKVYSIDRDTIVKVYNDEDALPLIHRERELARTAFVAGIPTAIPFDVVRIEGGGYGSVFELLNATSFAKLLIRGEKNVDEIAEMSIDLLKLIHSKSVKPDAMPDMKVVAEDWVDFLRDYLPKDQCDRLHELIDAVPEDHHMLHGDYHIKNVMLENGKSLLIDMDTLCYGHPIFELAFMYNAYRGYSEVFTSTVQNFLGISFETASELLNKSLRLYLAGRDEETIRAVSEKAALIGHVRILRRAIRRHGFDTEEGRAVIEYSKRRIADLLQRVDSLVF